MTEQADTPGPLRLGVLGGGSMVFRKAVLPALDTRDDVVLAAVCSRSGADDPAWDDVAVEDYDAVLAASEAVYLPLPNDLHLPWVERAARAGVHVLCEKPLTPDPDAARAAFSACEDAGVLLAEAWMTPFHPVLDTVRAVVDDGRVGEVLRVDTTFTFTIGPEHDDNYRWSAEHGGGALLDLGIYTLSPLLDLLAGPTLVAATTRDRGGVDATFHAVLRASDGAIGTATGSFEAPERQRLAVTGTRGRLVVDRPFTADPATDHLLLLTGDGEERLPVRGANDPYAAMLGAFAAAVRGTTPWPRSVEEVLVLADLVAEVRDLAAHG